MSPSPRSVAYHRPRPRRRGPAVLVGVLGLAVLVTAQLAVAGAVVVPGPGALLGAGQEPLAVGPTGAAPVVPGPGVAADPSLGPTPVLPTEPTEPDEPEGPDDPDGGSGGDLGVVPTTTVRFEAGAVLDEQARADLVPVLDVLASPDAAPVLLTGTAEPGTDVAASLRLAQRRADAVAEALVEGGAPASLLRTTGVVDPGAGRTVVLASEVP